MCVCVRVCVRARVCVVSVIVKRPVLPPSVLDGRSQNPLYYYYVNEYISGQDVYIVLPCSGHSGKCDR